uniref:Thioredoxin domain-containing protein n=1 Tax=Steinernema glaseri TaxID=37863 RepID=A0A1I8A8L6_9BILA
MSEDELLTRNKKLLGQTVLHVGFPGIRATQAFSGALRPPLPAWHSLLSVFLRLFAKRIKMSCLLRTYGCLDEPLGRSAAVPVESDSGDGRSASGHSTTVVLLFNCGETSGTPLEAPEETPSPAERPTFRVDFLRAENKQKQNDLRRCHINGQSAIDAAARCQLVSAFFFRRRVNHLMKLKLHSCTPSSCQRLLFLAVLLASVPLRHAALSSMTYVPMGNSPTLYRPGAEPIMHLDELTFTDTVLGQDHAFLVEFYADWCGHCRAFAPFFREFASLVQSWDRVVTVAVMNCADSFNTRVCRENGVTHFPMIKYYPRAARHASSAIMLEASHSGSQLRDQLSRTIVNEFNQFRYPDWPNFIYVNVDSSTTYGTLWQGVAESADYLAIIIEQYESVSPQ